MVKTRTVSDRLRSPNFRSWSKKTSLTNAFAIVCLQQIQEFHLWLLNTNAPSCSCQSKIVFLSHKRKDNIVLFHAELFKAIACWEHLGFFKVQPLVHCPTQSSAEAMLNEMQHQYHAYTPSGQTGLILHTSNYELFNRNNFNIRYWSWNYRGCWHQTCPPIEVRKIV